MLLFFSPRSRFLLPLYLCFVLRASPARVLLINRAQRLFLADGRTFAVTAPSKSPPSLRCLSLPPQSPISLPPQQSAATEAATTVAAAPAVGDSDLQGVDVSAGDRKRTHSQMNVKRARVLIHPLFVSCVCLYEC